MELQIELLEGPYGIRTAIDATRMSRRSNDLSDTRSLYHPGRRDMRLLQNLRTAGDEHAKALRGVVVYAEISGPRYWWTQFATYHIGVDILGSESTMYLVRKQPFEQIDFAEEIPPELLFRLNAMRELATVNLIKALLPESYIQNRIVMANYQALGRIYRQRKRHPLEEWRSMCDWIASLPYAKELIYGQGMETEREEDCG